MGAAADQYTVREHNTALILATLRQQEPISRAKIASETGLNRSTVSSIINKLIQAGMIEETELQSETFGRPGMLLKLNPNYGFTVGIDVNVDYIMAVVLDFTYNIVWQKRVIISPLLEQSEVLQQALDLTHTAVNVGIQRGMKALGIGVVLPGLVDVHEGVLTLGPNLHWENVPVRALWQLHFDLPVYVENDANAAAMGEYYLGEAKEAAYFVFINVGVGIGGGIMIEGNLLRGARGFASEIGHMVVEPDGAECACGSRGCLETVIGNTAVIASTQKALRAAPMREPFNTYAEIDALTLDQIVEAAQQGHPVCQQQLRRIGYYLGLIAGDLANIFNPDLVVIGGYSREMVAQLLPDLRSTAMANTMLVSRGDVDIRPSRFGASSSVIGAAALVFDQLTQPVF